MTIRAAPTLALLASTALVLGLGEALRDPEIPLGVPEEWTWNRIVPEGRGVVGLTLGLAALAAFAGIAALGMRAMALGPMSRGREAAWVAALTVAGLLAQVGALAAAPPGYGLAKVVTLGLQGSSGYYHVARSKMADPDTFLQDYPDWIRTQDAYHIGTHPPGLFLATRAAIDLMEGMPGLARAVDDAMPSEVADAFRSILGPIPRADRAALTLIALLILLGSAATTAPLYLLARGSGMDGPASWASATLWPLVPSAILFQPAADTAFPLLAATALALSTRHGPFAAAASGVVLAFGMAFTLAFLAVGLLVGLAIASAPSVPIRRRVLLGAAVGLGFLTSTLLGWAASGANPFEIWWWNQANHARFYVENPRSYTRWIVANPIELAVALGLPAVVWAVPGLAGRRSPRITWLVLVVLALLTLSGRNLSEVARLWLPFVPPLLLASGAGLARLKAGPITLAATLALTALQVLLLESSLQVVYPV